MDRGLGSRYRRGAPAGHATDLFSCFTLLLVGMGGITSKKSEFSNASEPQVEENRPDEDSPEDVLDEDPDFEDYTVGTSVFSGGGTDDRVLRIMKLTERERDEELLNAATVGDEYEVSLLLKFGAHAKRLDWDQPVLSTSFQACWRVDQPPSHTLTPESFC